MMVRMGLKDGLLACAKYGGLFAATRFATRRSLRILCYHGLWTSPGAPYGECLFMPVDQFADRMRWLKASRYPVLDLDDALARFENGTLPDNAVVITIDDGWRSTYSHMLPILTELALPSTLYASTYYVQKQTPVVNVALGFLFDRSPRASLDLHDLLPAFAQPIVLGDASSRARHAALVNKAINALPTLAERIAMLLHIADRAGVPLDPADDQFRYMSPAELLEAETAGMRIELHTHRHYGANNPDRDIAGEIADNRAALAQAGIAGEKRHFCYPSGGTAAGIESLLTSCGIISATTTLRGLNPPGTRPHHLGRLLDGENVSQLGFEAWLAGIYHPLDGRPDRLD
jgi:peptidoglycan/xylan/chitin deacetylase (PgdA/CDA1 family)